ncbi:hypothetical protein ACQY0O_006775 [Thecaphora frezii]
MCSSHFRDGHASAQIPSARSLERMSYEDAGATNELELATAETLDAAMHQLSESTQGKPEAPASAQSLPHSSDLHQCLQSLAGFAGSAPEEHRPPNARRHDTNGGWAHSKDQRLPMHPQYRQPGDHAMSGPAESSLAEPARRSSTPPPGMVTEALPSSLAAWGSEGTPFPTPDGTPNPPDNTPQFDMRLQPPPPGYHTLDFPATPPALQLVEPHSLFDEAFERQLRMQEACVAPPPPDHPPPPIETGPAGGGGRFPRWRGWLEKRALERHYARMDAAAGIGPTDSSGGLTVQPPIRKKSWGTGVNDPDAVDDDSTAVTCSSDEEDECGNADPSSLPPLHIHHYGSRFIPHLHSQPLCSVLLELPPASPRSGLQRIRRRPRQVVLIGTADGLFLFQKQARKERSSNHADVRNASGVTGPSSQESAQVWPDETKCLHVWSGLGIYQMCLLSSNEPASNPGPLPSSSRSQKSAPGILLALTAPTSTATPSYLPKQLVQLSAHAGTVFESVGSPSGGGFGGSSGSSHGHGSSYAEGTEGIAAANFGCAAGGGPGRAVPPGGSGTVKMWNLEVLKKILLYALDHESPKLPIDLVGERTTSKEKKSSLPSMLKKAFAKDKTRAEKASKRPGAARSLVNDGVGVIDPLPTEVGLTGSRHGSPRTVMQALEGDFQRGMRSSQDLIADSGRLSFQSDDRSVESFAAASSRDDRDSLIAKDPDLATALALSLSSVPISAPNSGASTAGHSNAAQGSYSSLFGDDAYGPGAGKHASGKGKDKEHSASAASRGVLFFTVHEAGPDTKGSGTWYLALATSKSVMVYEAVPAKRGSGRSWAWMKELYAPFAIKAIAFAPASVADAAATADKSTVVASGVHATTKLRVSSADAPLSASHKGAGHGNATGKRPHSGYSSILKPYHSLASAAPASWHRADLCVLVSFGRRSVVIRLSDSNVREFELMPLSEVVAAASGGSSTIQPHLALLPGSLDPTAMGAKERPRPHSIISLGLTPTISNPSPAHSRFPSSDRLRDPSPHDAKASKHNWVGFTTLQAQIRVRQHVIEAEVDHRRSQSSVPQGMAFTVHNLAFPRPASLVHPPNDWRLPGPPRATSVATGRNKELPPPPTTQNLSFDRRSSRQYLDAASRMAYEAVQADSSSGSDDDYESQVDVSTRGYALQDVAPGRPSTGGRNMRGGHHRPKRGATQDIFASTHLVSVRMALVSRGSITQVLPLPLPVDLAKPLPLAVLQWSDTPNSVSGWARVLGIERVWSSGPVSIERWRQDSSASAHGSGAFSSQSPQPGFASRPNKSNVLGIHVGITVLAFLPSRIEMKRVSFKMETAVGFDLLRNAELELVPPLPPATYTKPVTNDGASQQELNDRPGAGSKARGKNQSRNSIFGLDHIDGCWRAPFSSSRPFSNLSTSTLQTTASDRIGGSEAPADDTETRAWADQELEYLCGNLLTINPIDLDVSSAGSEAAVLRLMGDADAASWSGESRGQVLKELAGDGGIVAFDWRGAEDYRIFCVGAQG